LERPDLDYSAKDDTGNFFNSEILGTPSNLPWAVIFARIDNIPRHPAMLYEAAAFLLIFCGLYVAYWKTTIIQFPGRVFGTTLATGFLARFLIEFVKENQPMAFAHGTAFEHSFYSGRHPSYLYVTKNIANAGPVKICRDI